jgi:hypothetical protein
LASLSYLLTKLAMSFSLASSTASLLRDKFSISVVKEEILFSAALMVSLNTLMASLTTSSLALSSESSAFKLLTMPSKY